jgi:hypothetical protein
MDKGWMASMDGWKDTPRKGWVLWMWMTNSICIPHFSFFIPCTLWRIASLH